MEALRGIIYEGMDLLSPRSHLGVRVLGIDTVFMYTGCMLYRRRFTRSLP